MKTRATLVVADVSDPKHPHQDLGASVKEINVGFGNMSGVTHWSDTD